MNTRPGILGLPGYTRPLKGDGAYVRSPLATLCSTTGEVLIQADLIVARGANRRVYVQPKGTPDA